jgi:ribose transport system substrate-binding protein
MEFKKEAIMWKRAIFTLLLVLFLVPVASAKDFRFVIVPKVVHPWFDEVNKGAKEEAMLLEKQLGVKIVVDYVAPTTADVTEQNSILERVATTKPDGITVDPLDASGNRQVFIEIMQRGIKLMTFDSPPPPDLGIGGVGNNFTQQANIAAEMLLKLVGYKGEIAVMQGFPTAPNHKERYDAHLAYLKKFPNVKIIDGGIDNDSINTAQQQAAAVLASHPNLVGYLNCDATSAGIAAAIREAGKVGKVRAVLMDSLHDEVMMVKEGIIDGLSATKPREQGALAVLMLYQAAIGGRTPYWVDTGIDVITKANVDEWLRNNPE